MTQQPDNINMDSLLSKEDMDKLVELLGQNSVSLGGGNSKKNNKLTPQAKNFLLNQLSSHQKIQEVQKPFKDMNEQEKKEYREGLRSRLHNKQAIFKQQRTNHNLLQKSLDAKLKKEQQKEESEKSEEDEQPNQTDEQNQTDKTDKTDKSDESDESETSDKTDSLDKTKEKEDKTKEKEDKNEFNEKLEDFLN